MNNTKIFVALLLLGICFGNTGSIAQSTKKSFEVSAFSGYATMATNTKAIAKSRTTVKQLFAGWVATCDKVNGMFTDIYGTPQSINGATDIEKSQNCMTDKLGRLGIKQAEWNKVSDYEAPKANYVNYKQTVNGHEVVFSWLSFRFTKSGDLARIQMKNYGSPTGKAVVALSADEAQKAAIKDLTEVTISQTKIDPNWAWFPIPTAKGYELHPAWHFTIKGNIPGSVPLKLTGYVDATNGKILYRTNEIKETGYDVTVKGLVYRNGMLNPPTLEALPYLKIVNGADTIYTDTTGYASDGAITLPHTSLIPLKGKWSTVIDSTTGLNPAFNDAITASGSVYTYPTTAPSSNRHVNAYYHVNRIHNFMKQYFPSFYGMDFSLPTIVDEVGGTCNAFYDGTAINFYAAGGGCYSFATFGDVIYHEYGHGISDHFYTNITTTTIVNGSLNEALSDIWALSITHSPVLAANAFTAYGGFIRRYDLTPQVYPIDLNLSPIFADVHENGQIIAGTWWDVGVNLGSVDSMTKLFTQVYFDVPDGATGTEGLIYQTILIDALMADDNDGNLFNGTPHYAQIVKAFARHGIYMEGDATITHTEIVNQSKDTAITVKASLSLSRPEYFHDLTLYYRTNDTSTWHGILLTGDTSNLTGVIPAQPKGTIVDYYFVIHDSTHTPNAYFPITCNPNNPDYQSSIPYQFGVGLIDKDSIDFEGAAPGWGISGNSGDDATLGLWQQVVPTANLIITAFPGNDHTTGSGQCLITGTGMFSFTNFFGQGVANGTSTVVSPVFDISGFACPVISYYRWFSNDQGSNFKNDPWVVKIGDSATGTWQTVERTYQSDVNWRRRIVPVRTYLPTTNKLLVKFFASDSVLANWANNGQSTTVGAMDDFYIYDIDTTGLAVKNIFAPKANIYPNPADDYIKIVFDIASFNGTIYLADMAGNKVAQLVAEPNKYTYTINTKQLAVGQYLLVIQAAQFIQSKKIVVTHAQY